MELVTGQGIESIEDIKNLAQDRVTCLFSIIRKPGRGTNGHVVSKSAENIFHLLVYYFQHQYCVTWNTDHSLVTLVNLRALCGQREIKKDWDSTITEYVKPVFKDIPKTFEMIKELLSKSRGASGVPSNYVIRTDLPPSDGADDPGTNYTSKDVEMIARAPILLELGVGDEEIGLFHEILQVDQKKVYDILFTIFNDTETLVYSKTSHKEKRGRKLFLALYEHYLGPNKVDHLSASLTCTLHNIDYHREKKNWNFEKYQAAYLEQHNISVGLEGQGYSGIDYHAKVRYLISGTNNDKLKVVKNQVVEYPALRKYSTGLFSLFYYIKKCEGMNHAVRTIS